MKLKTLLEDEGWENVQPSEDVEQEMKWVLRKQAALQHAQEISVAELRKYSPMFIDSWEGRYKDMEPTAKFITTVCDFKMLSSQVALKKILVPNDTPNINKIWPAITRLANQTVKHNAAYQKLDKIRKTLNKQYRELTMSKVNTAGVSVASPEEIKEVEINNPHIFIAHRKMTNPLSVCPTQRYVGPPEKFPLLTGTQADIFIKIQQALKIAGIGPLTLLYGGRTDQNYINFVMMNDKKDFVWRKYQTSAQGGQNTIYFKDGTTVNTNTFVHKPAAFLNDHQK